MAVQLGEFLEFWRYSQKTIIVIKQCVRWLPQDEGVIDVTHAKFPSAQFCCPSRCLGYLGAINLMPFVGVSRRKAMRMYKWPTNV